MAVKSKQAYIMIYSSTTKYSYKSVVVRIFRQQETIIEFTFVCIIIIMLFY